MKKRNIRKMKAEARKIKGYYIDELDVSDPSSPYLRFNLNQICRCCGTEADRTYRDSIFLDTEEEIERARELGQAILAACKVVALRGY